MPLHIPHITETQSKIDIIKANLNTAHIVVDFDGTLTQYFDNAWKARPSIISILRDEWILDEEYSKVAKEMYAHYSWIEHDESLSNEYKTEKMVERWSDHTDLIMKKWLKRSQLEHIIEMDLMVMRPWVGFLLKQAQKLGIPVTIFSASGIGTDCITLLLKHRWLSFPNEYIVSNTFSRDENGNMIWHSLPFIHSLNKKESVIRESESYKSIQDAIKNRPNAILIGDWPWDADMVDEKPWNTVFKIWLCNDKVEERIGNYEKLFDVIITHDDGLDEVVNMILS
jgi:HAD superfamily hydrolase (TIGR01544 family)